MATAASPEHFIWDCPVTGEAIAIPEHVIVRQGQHQAMLPSYDGIPYKGVPLSQPEEYVGRLTHCPTPDNTLGILAVSGNAHVRTKMFRLGQSQVQRGYFDVERKQFRPVWKRHQAVGKTLLMEMQVTDLLDLDHRLILPRYNRSHAQLFI